MTPYEEAGKKARDEGVSIRKNPYSYKSPKRKEWSGGWKGLEVPLEAIVAIPTPTLRKGKNKAHKSIYEPVIRRKPRFDQDELEEGDDWFD